MTPKSGETLVKGPSRWHLLRILPDGFAVTWWGWCPQRTLKEIENEKNRTKATAVKNALV